MNQSNELVEELKTTFREMQYPYNSSESTVKVWMDSVRRLRQLVLNANPEKFLQWDVIKSMMFVSFEKTANIEFSFLRNLSTWKNRWCKAIEESTVGDPILYSKYPRSSGNLVHTAYHVAQFEEKTKICVSDIDFVFEFGGGYGSMCRLLHNLGFHGKYIIFDFPAFSALQTFFLKSIGIKIQPIESFKELTHGVFCISDLVQLEGVLSDCKMMNNSIFIATWSISETPLDTLRNIVLSFASQFKGTLIAYQDQFRKINNFEFFNNWKSSMDNIEWYHWSIEHLKFNRYLMGINKNVSFW